MLRNKCRLIVATYWDENFKRKATCMEPTQFECWERWKVRLPSALISVRLQY